MRSFVRVVLFATGLAYGIAPTAAPAAGPFTETGGVVVFEAEDFDSQDLHGSDHQWMLSNSVAGASGSGYVEATPNNALNNGGSTWITTQPELKYMVNFSVTPLHYVWIRGYAASNTDDS